jgi:hypothetical protein
MYKYSIAVLLSLTAFQTALATETDLSKPVPSAEYKQLSPEQREKFHTARKAKWDSMSKEEKLTTIEKRHAAKKAKMEEKWNSSVCKSVWSIRMMRKSLTNYFHQRTHFGFSTDGNS